MTDPMKSPVFPTVWEAIANLGLSLTEDEFLARFKIEGPALISFSGGRTSALMLWCVLVAHGGKLPDDVVVTFANTGKEREETLRFVYECGSRWGVPIVWLEWRIGKPGYEIVGFNSASREGEPFTALIEKKGYLPNAVTRFCTSELKVRVMKHFAQRTLGWKNWKNVIGLRFDEGHRVLKRLHHNSLKKEAWVSVMPLARAGVTVRTVKRFWLGPTMRFPSNTLPQGFDLGLYDYEGNCDGCMLKSLGKKLRIEQDRPGTLAWWAAREASITMNSPSATDAGRRFTTEYSFADIQRWAHEQPLLINDDLLDLDDEGECTGGTCDEGPGGEGARAYMQRMFEQGLDEWGKPLEWAS